MNAAGRESGIGNRESSNPVRGRLLRDEPMARHTSWRVGGPADRFFEPADRDDLIAFVRALPADEPLLWLGLGSNLLVRDGGWRGTVICLHGALDALRLESANDSAFGYRGMTSSHSPTGPNAPIPDSRLLYAEAGVHCARLAKFAEREKLAGLGFMAGIPGTVGGALAMNAGAWGGETWPRVAAAELLLRGGGTAWVGRDAVHYRYRHVELPDDALGFLAACFEVEPDPEGEHARYTRAALAQRKATQPVGRPSAGSTFRNPPDDHAARLIESCGLKGHRIGGAEVSTQHANFIVTDADARAADVEALIRHIALSVRERTGVELVTEVRIVGEQP